MKSKLIYLVLLCAGPFVMSSCDKDTEGKTWTTYYPSIQILGSNPAVTNIGEPYVDEGYYAETNGEDVSDQVIVDTSDLNTNEVGLYNINYIIYNTEGFSATTSREVYVVNPNSIATIYMSESQYGTSASYHYYDAPIFITDNGDGTYEIDDICGGFWFYGYYARYSSYDFHIEANIAVADDGTVTMIGDAGSWYYERSGSTVLNSGTYDAATKTFKLDVTSIGWHIYVTLVPLTKDYKL